MNKLLLKIKEWWIGFKNHISEHKDDPTYVGIVAAVIAAILLILLFIGFLFASAYDTQNEKYMKDIVVRDKSVTSDASVKSDSSIESKIETIKESIKENKTEPAPIPDPKPMEVEETIVVEETPQPETVSVSAIDASYDTAVIYLAKTVWGEARGCSATEQAAVIWCILNRVDNWYGSTSPDAIIKVVTQPGQFHGYAYNFPITDEIKNLTIDVLNRWLSEKNGNADSGRVLPSDYMWFGGDGTRNNFRNAYSGGTRWNWSLPSPYVG